MRRLWVASLEEDAIRDALASMKDETEYQGLADSAMIRAKADWLIGMNASRAYSLVYNARFTVGRVQTPTLAMIVDRDRQIAGHVARPYWKVVAPMGGWKLTGERLDKGEDAETLLRIVNSDDFAFSIFKADRKQQHDEHGGSGRQSEHAGRHCRSSKYFSAAFTIQHRASSFSSLASSYRTASEWSCDWSP